MKKSKPFQLKGESKMQTMKKLLTILVVLVIPFSSWAGGVTMLARMNPYIAGSVPVVSGDSCTGALLFSAHFENNDDVTVGTPAGCSVGDTTIAKTGASFSSVQKYDGGYSILSSGTSQYAQIDTTNVLGLKTTGSYVAYIYHTRAGNSRVFTFTNGTNLITGTVVYNAGNPYISLSYNGTQKNSATTFTNSTWTKISFAWDASPASGSRILRVRVGEGAWESTTNSTMTAITTDLTVINIVSASGQDSGFYLDVLKIYSSNDGT